MRVGKNLAGPFAESRISARRKLAARVALMLTIMLCSGGAHAHPHVWVKASTGIVFAPDGRITELRHQWAFDDAYSAFAVQGLDKDNDGIYSREELAELARVNVESLAEFGFFTVIKVDGKKLTLGAPKGEWLEYRDGVLRLHFSLPVEAAVKARTAYGLEVFDPTYFVSFGFEEGDQAVALVSSPQGCAVQIQRARDPSPEQQKLSEADFSAFEGLGAQFASKAVIACP